MNSPSLFLALSTMDILSPSTRSVLSAKEVQKIEQLTAPNRIEEYACGRILLRHLLEEVTGVPAAAHQLGTTNSGKPVCENGPDVSISHSQGLIACAVSLDGLVGVDVELTGSHRDTGRIAKCYFSPVESEWLKTQSEDRFYMLWVLKEAWLKAVGAGVAGGLHRLQCRVKPPAIEITLDHPNSYVFRLFTSPRAFLALAANGTGYHPTKLLQWDSRVGRLKEARQLREIAWGESPGNVATCNRR